MAWFDKLKPGRKLRNGSGDFVRVRTATNEAEGVDWWLDTCRVVDGFSKGDRSAFLAAMKAHEGGDTATLLTAAGSVTQELYLRMGHLGYFAPAEEGPAPGTLSHRPTEFAKLRAMLFFAATMAVMNDAKGDLKPLQSFCQRFAKLDQAHTHFDLQSLQELAEMFLHEAGPIRAVAGTNQDKVWQAYVRVGAFEETEDGVWQITPFGRMVAPFLLHRLLHKRRRATD